MKNPEQQALTKNGWEQRSEAEAVSRLAELGVKNVETAFAILEEKDINNKPLENVEIFWAKFGAPKEEGFGDLLSVEGKVYFPKTANGELVLFTPGFPGGVAGRFEQRYARAFTEAGYAFATVRHNGASLTNGEMSEQIMNCPKRLEIAKQAGEHHIGGTREQGYSPSEMINEPINLLASLQGKFKRVHLMGQSMGVASSYNVATKFSDNAEITGKLGNIVGISGYVGTTEETPDGIWNALKQNFNTLAEYEKGYMERVDLNAPRDSKWYATEMKKVAAQNEKMRVPSHVGNILVFSPEDPLIVGPDKSKEQYALNYGPKSQRKLIIEDLSKPADDKKAHSMLWIAPENLVRAVQAKVSERGPHYLKVGGVRGSGLVQKG